MFQEKMLPDRDELEERDLHKKQGEILIRVFKQRETDKNEK